MPNVVYTITVDEAGAVQGIHKVGAALTQTGQAGKTAFGATRRETDLLTGAFGHLGNTIKNIFTILGVVSLAGWIREGIDAAYEFQRAWTKVAVIMRGERDTTIISRFKQEILELPPILGTATKNAEAFYQILSSGFTKPAEAMTLLRAAAVAAAGGFTTTEVAVRSGAAVLQAYGMDVSKATHVFDVMAKTVDLGVISFEEMATELGSIIPIAAANGISFEEVSGAIAALTLQGVPASMAITGLRSTLVSLLEPNAAAEKAAQRLGINWSASAVKAYGLQEVLGQLNDRSKVSSKDIAELTGRVEALNTVTNLTSKEGVSKLNTSIEGTRNASDKAGASQDSLKKASEQAAFAWVEFANSATNAAIALGNKLAPAATSTLKSLTDIIAGAREGVPVLNELTIAIGSVAAGFLAVKLVPFIDGMWQVIRVSKLWTELSLAFQFKDLVGGFSAVGAAISSQTKAMFTMTAASTMTITQFGLIAAAAATLAYALIELYGYWRNLTIVQEENRASLVAMAADLSARGVTGMKAWVAALQAGRISEEAFIKALEEMGEAQKKNDPTAYFKPDKLKEFNELASKVGVTTVQALKRTAQQASDLVEKIQQIGPVSKNYDDVLAAAIEARDKAWQAFNKEVASAKGSTDDFKKKAQEAAKALKEMASAAGSNVLQLKEQLKNAEAYVAYLIKEGVANGELFRALQKVKDIRGELNKAQSLGSALADTEIKRIKALIDGWEKWGDTAEKGNDHYATANYNAMELTDTLHRLGLVAGDRIPQAFQKAASAILSTTGSFKTLGVVSTAELEKTANAAKAAYETILADATTSDRDRVLSWAKAQRAIQELALAQTGQIDAETMKLVKEIEDNFGSLKDNKDANLTNWAELSKRQVSTLVSDVSKGFADILFDAGSFGEKMVAAFKNIFSGIVQAFFESGIMGLLSGKGFSGFSGFLSGLGNLVTQGMGGGGGGKTIANYASMIGIGSKAATAAGIGSKVATAAGVGGLFAAAPAIASPGLFMGAGSALGGSIPISMAGLASPTMTGAGTAAGAAGSSGSFLGSMGSLLTNPWTIGIAGAAIGGTLLYRKLTQRGREKEWASTGKDGVGGAENLSNDVWNVIIPAVEAGTKTIEQGILDVQGAWDTYVKFLHSNLKDQTVIQRSIDSQRISLTEGLARLKEIQLEREWAPMLEGMQALKEEAQALIPTVENLWASFVQTGKVSGDLRKQIEDLGGDVAAFEEYARIKNIKASFAGLVQQLNDTGVASEELIAIMKEFGVSGRELEKFLINLNELRKLQETRKDFQALRQEIEKLIPAQKTAIQLFMETGEVTDALRKQVTELGGDIEAFERFSAIRKMQSDFESLARTVLETGEGVEALIPIFEKAGVSTEALRGALNIGPLREQLSGFAAIQKEIEKLVPAAKSPYDEFIQTGRVSTDLQAIIAARGGDTGAFNKFSVAKENLAQFEALAKPFDKLETVTGEFIEFIKRYQTTQAGIQAKALLDSNANAQQIISAMREQLTSEQIQAAKDLLAALGLIQNNIKTEIETLQEGLETALQDVRDKLADEVVLAAKDVVKQLDIIDQTLAEQIGGKQESVTSVLRFVGTMIDTSVQNAATRMITAIDTMSGNVTNAIKGGTPPTEVFTPPPPETQLAPNPWTSTAVRQGRNIVTTTDTTRVQGLATGGVIRTPMILIDPVNRTHRAVGEAGPEAILPMRQVVKMMETRKVLDKVRTEARETASKFTQATEQTFKIIEKSISNSETNKVFSTQLPGMANGGIIKTPMILMDPKAKTYREVGEAGPELVIPVSKLETHKTLLDRITTNNTQSSRMDSKLVDSRTVERLISNNKFTDKELLRTTQQFLPQNQKAIAGATMLREMPTEQKAIARGAVTSDVQKGVTGLAAREAAANYMPGLQHGGVITSPMILFDPKSNSRRMIGEAGPEAVVPLKTSPTKPTPSDTADRGGDITVILELDGQRLGQVLIPRLNRAISKNEGGFRDKIARLRV